MARAVAVPLLLCLAALVSSESGSLARNATSVHSPLQTWLGGLVVPIPVGKSGELPMGMGNLTLTGGSCRGIRIAGFASEDFSKGQQLEFEAKISGLEIECYIEAEAEGDLQINITFGSSNLDVTISVEPMVSPSAPDYPLPAGALNLTACAADLVVTAAAFTGTSEIVMATSYMPPDVLASMIGGFINDPLCEALRGALQTQGAVATNTAANIVASMLLVDPWSPHESEPLKPVVFWNVYPPMLVLQAMLKDRFQLWADKVISIMNVRTFDVLLANTYNTTVSLVGIEVEGIGPKHKPGVNLDLSGQTMNVLADLHGLTLRSMLRIKVTLPDAPLLDETVSISLGLNNFSMGIRALVDAEKLSNLEMDQVMENPQCAADTMAGTADPPSDALAFTKLAVGIQNRFRVDTPGSIETGIAQLLNSAVGAVLTGYMPSVDRMLNGAMAMARHPINAILWKKINSQPKCSHTNMLMGVNEGFVSKLWSISSAIYGIGFLVAFVAQFFRFSCTKLHDVPVPSTTSEAVSIEAPPAETDPEIVSVEGAPEEIQEMRLAAQPTVPTFLAVFFPFAVLGSVFLFLFAALDIGAFVNINTRASGSEAAVGPVFSFSLLSTIVESWHSGAYFISIVTLATSGVWPFVKLSLLLVCWLTPPQCFCVKARGRVLDFLDMWGKYSYVDSWFLVLSMSAFALDWRGIGNTSMRVQTVPTAAFYAYFVATSLSICLGLIVSHHHHKAITYAAEELEPERSQAIKIQCQHAAAQRLCRLVASKRVRVGVTAVLAVTALLSLLGIFLVSFTFEVSGIAMEFLFGNVVRKDYSLFAVGSSVAKDRYAEIGLLGLEIVFLALAVVAPILQVAALGTLWGAPLKIPGQQKLLNFCIVLDAWASLDVAVVVLVISCFQFGKMAEFLVEKSGFAKGCDFIKNLTQEDCFRVEMTATPGMAILIIAGVVLMVLPKVLLRVCTDLLSKRLELLEGAPGASRGEKLGRGYSRVSRWLGLEPYSAFTPKNMEGRSMDVDNTLSLSTESGAVGTQ